MPEGKPYCARTVWKPAMLQEVEAEIEHDGVVPAISSLLVRSRVHIEAQGELREVATHPGGILFVGDHQHQWEFLGLMDTLNRMGRHDLLHIAKFYVQRQIRMTLGQTAAASIVPVYPRALASDRKAIWNTEILNRVAYHAHLLSLEQSAPANSASLQVASDHLSTGGMVNIFPGGSIADWANHPWRSGVGHILAGIAGERKASVMVVPYRALSLSRARLYLAVASRGRAVRRGSQTIAMQFGPQIHVTEILDSLPAGQRADPEQITVQLRRYALGCFPDPN